MGGVKGYARQVVLVLAAAAFLWSCSNPLEEYIYSANIYIAIDSQRVQSEETFNLGQIEVGETTEIELQIENQGNEDLELTSAEGVQFSGDHAGFFSLKNAPAKRIGPGDSITVTLLCTPSFEMSPFKAGIVIKNNDVKFESFILNFEGISFKQVLSLTGLSPSHDGVTIDTSPSIAWNPVSGASSYQIQVSASNSFSDDSPAPLPVDSGAQYTYPNILNSGDMLYWRVRAIDGGGGSGPWSNVFYFTVDLDVTWSGISPGNASYINQLSPELLWNSVTGAGEYALKQSTSEGDLPGMTPVSVSTPHYSVPSSLVFGESIYWQVQAVNDEESVSNWSPVYSFTTTGAVWDGFSPVSGTNLHDITPTISWNDVGAEDSYVLSLNGNEVEITETSYAVPAGTVDFGDTLLWKVKAKLDGGNTSSWSDDYTLTFNWDYSLGTISPADGIEIGETAPLLDWSSTSDATSGYEVQYGSSVDLSGSDTTNASTTQSPDDSQYQLPSLTVGTWYWRVRPVNEHNPGPWSSIFSFEITTSIEIVLEMDEPVTVIFTGQSSSLPYGTDMTVTATLSREVDALQWFLEGDTLGAEIAGPIDETSLTLGSGLSPGRYELTLQVQSGSVIDGASLYFQVME